jgi:biopolymer transport protein ExbD
MADIEGGGGGKHKGGKPKSKKVSTRVDFTPMVDLGFLLITFFMLTTSMNKPKTMEITFPVDPDKEIVEENKIKASQAMTILLGESDRIYYYFGLGDEGIDMQTTNYSRNGIRKVLLEENRKRNPRADSIPILKNEVKTGIISDSVYKSRVSDIKRQKGALIVLIKATDESSYKNMIDIIDEMSICSIGSYSIVDIQEMEKEILSKVSVEGSK